MTYDGSGYDGLRRTSDRDLILQLLSDVQDMKSDIHQISRAVNGNGQPGLVTRVARLEGASAKTTAASGGLSALVAVVAAVIMQKLGIGS